MQAHLTSRPYKTMRTYLIILFTLAFGSSIAQDQVHIFIEINGQAIYMNAENTGQTVFISSEMLSKWIIPEKNGCVSIQHADKRYLNYQKENKEIVLSTEKKTDWKFTSMGGLRFFIQPCDDHTRYLSIFGSEIKLLPYNADLRQSIYQQWTLNEW